MIVRILEGRSIPEIEAHHLCELASWNTDTQVDGIAVDITGVDLGGLDVDDRLVLRITASTLMGGERMTWPKRRLSGIAQRDKNILVQGVGLLHRLLRLCQLILGTPLLLFRCGVIPPLNRQGE